MNLRELADRQGREPTSPEGEASRRFPVLVTEYYASLIDWGDANDPLLRMVFPDAREMGIAGVSDPSGESRHTVLPGLQRKFKDTVLALVASGCAAYCRFCFRKRFVGKSSEELLTDYRQAVAYMQENGDIESVVVSGGDPMTLTPSKLSGCVDALCSAPNITSLRIDTRMAAFDPRRMREHAVLPELVGVGKRRDTRISIIHHFNHPREITTESIVCLRYLRSLGYSQYNQSVLLRGVNDSVETLTELMRQLVGQDVAPYYVFQAKNVRGGEYFGVPLHSACRLMSDVRSEVDGLAGTFRHVVSNSLGKVELVGSTGGAIVCRMLRKSIQFRCVPDVFTVHADESECFLPETTGDVLPLEGLLHGE